MDEKDEITIINTGWDYACEKMPAKLSYYASQGYILSHMDEKVFVLVREEPRDIEYAIITSDVSPQMKDEMLSAGWEILCENCGHSAYTAPAGTAFPGAENNNAADGRRHVFSRILILLEVSAVLMFFLLRAHPGNEVLSVLRSIAAFIVSVIFGFSAFSLVSLIRRKK